MRKKVVESLKSDVLSESERMKVATARSLKSEKKLKRSSRSQKALNRRQKCFKKL